MTELIIGRESLIPPVFQVSFRYLGLFIVHSEILDLIRKPNPREFRFFELRALFGQNGINIAFFTFVVLNS